MANYTKVDEVYSPNLTNLVKPESQIFGTPDDFDFAVHGILLTSVGLAGLVANVLCLLVLHRPALKVGRQVSCIFVAYVDISKIRFN